MGYDLLIMYGKSLASRKEICDTIRPKLSCNHNSRVHILVKPLTACVAARVGCLPAWRCLQNVPPSSLLIHWNQKFRREAGDPKAIRVVTLLSYNLWRIVDQLKSGSM
jgi:hypothetical protein